MSEDLWVRVVEAREAGESIAQVAERFSVSVSSVKRLRRQIREQGRLDFRSPPGRPARFEGDTLNAFAVQLGEHNDWTLMQHQKAWQAATGVRVGVSTLHRVCQKLNWTLKKSPAPDKRAGPTGCRLAQDSVTRPPAGNSSPRCNNSTRTKWCCSMKLQPVWA